MTKMMWCLYDANVSWPSVQSAHSVTKHRSAQLDGGGRSGQLPGQHHPAPAGVGQGGRRGGYIVMSCLLSCHVLCQGCQVTGNVMNNMSGGGHLRARGGGRLGDAGGGTVCPD